MHRTVSQTLVAAILQSPWTLSTWRLRDHRPRSRICKVHSLRGAAVKRECKRERIGPRFVYSCGLSSHAFRIDGACSAAGRDVYLLERPCAVSSCQAV